MDDLDRAGHRAREAYARNASFQDETLPWGELADAERVIWRSVAAAAREDTARVPLSQADLVFLLSEISHVAADPSPDEIWQTYQAVKMRLEGLA